MIYKIFATNPAGETLEMELAHPEKSGIAVMSVDGIGPVNAVINVNPFALIDGGAYSSARVPERNITMTLRMWTSPEVPTIEESRHLLYNFFQIKKQVFLEFLTDKRTSKIEGFVEANPPNIFSDAESSTVSIICPDPWFRSKDIVDFAFAGVHNHFEFPFSNESLTDDLIIFGEIHTDTRAVLPYGGDVDSGMLIDVHFSKPETGFGVYNIDTNQRMEIDDERIKSVTGQYFQASDTLYISTIPGEKSVLLLRNGVYYNVISALKPGYQWLYLVKGDNKFAFTVAGDVTNVVMTFRYYERYAGI